MIWLLLVLVVAQFIGAVSAVNRDLSDADHAHQLVNKEQR